MKALWFVEWRLSFLICNTTSGPECKCLSTSSRTESTQEMRAASFCVHVFKTVVLQCIWLTWIICARQLYAKLYVSARARLSAHVISLPAAIWPESETLRYHTVGPARCQGVRVPRWLGCLAKYLFPLTSGIRRCTYKAIFHFDSKVFFFFMWVTLALTQPNEQPTFGFGEMCMFVHMWPLL